VQNDLQLNATRSVTKNAAELPEKLCGVQEEGAPTTRVD
jgi:hypothetical protein